MSPAPRTHRPSQRSPPLPGFPLAPPHRRASGLCCCGTYSRQQADGPFRRTWLRLLPRLDAARWWLAPSTGTPHLRIPCPHTGCGWAEKHAERTSVRLADRHSATVAAVCLHHGAYQATITPTAGVYLDLATLYRNLVKELTLTKPTEGGTLHVMVKGGDWVFGSLLIDEALQAVDLTRTQLPARFFCPQVVTDTGAKLSKSLIREGHTNLPTGAAGWTPDSGPARSPNTPTNCWP